MTGRAPAPLAQTVLLPPATPAPLGARKAIHFIRDHLGGSDTTPSKPSALMNEVPLRLLKPLLHTGEALLTSGALPNPHGPSP